MGTTCGIPAPVPLRASQRRPNTARCILSKLMASPSRLAASLHLGILSLLSAFLLFQVQPVISKFILPWFGGGPGVWTTCMLFFQVVLLAGYAYAHASARGLKPRGQVILHCSVLAAALLLLPIIPADGWKPYGAGDPT